MDLAISNVPVLTVRWPTASLKKQNTMPKNLQAQSMMRKLRQSA